MLKGSQLTIWPIFRKTTWKERNLGPEGKGERVPWAPKICHCNYRPRMRQGNVFTGVCLSTGGGWAQPTRQVGGGTRTPLPSFLAKWVGIPPSPPLPPARSSPARQVGDPPFPSPPPARQVGDLSPTPRPGRQGISKGKWGLSTEKAVLIVFLKCLKYVFYKKIIYWFYRVCRIYKGKHSL